MASNSSSEIELRCSCSRRPLLAVCRIDKRTGNYSVHVKSYRQQRIFVDAEFANPTSTRLTCRECLRDLRVQITHGAAELVAASS